MEFVHPLYPIKHYFIVLELQYINYENKCLHDLVI